MARVHNPDHYKVGGSPKEDAAKAAASRAKYGAQLASERRKASRKGKQVVVPAPTKRRRAKAMPNAAPETTLARFRHDLGEFVLTALREPRKRAEALYDGLRERATKVSRSAAELAAAPLTVMRALRILREPSKPR